MGSSSGQTCSISEAMGTKHTRYNSSEKGRARHRRYNAKRAGTLRHYLAQRRSQIRVRRGELTNQLEDLV